jgi:hypothetical protein
MKGSCHKPAAAEKGVEKLHTSSEFKSSERKKEEYE